MAKALILIIDASEATRRMYADYFRFHGYAVADAADREGGMRLAQELQPDLIVTELSGEPGWVHAVQVFRGTGAGREAAIVACSTLIDAWWPRGPEELDVDRALPKPASPRVLLEEAEQLLAHRTRAPRVAHGPAADN
jgi:DNA-binding NarL/FixJ family response regulator